MRRAGALVAALALVSAVSACADPNPHSEVVVGVDEYSLHVSPASSDEGTVKMFVDNTGRLKHTLVFIRAKSLSDLPLKLDGSVDLTKVQVADQLERFGPGKYRIAPEFFPGPLVVFCNLVTKGPDGQPISHYQRGMHAELRIRDTES